MYYTTTSWDMQDSPIPSNTTTGVAPFVMKTYQMVSDPNTDYLISWGRNNNTFIVVDPLQFARLILPSNFKHSNFSSFIRQLNTYGFKKVDPDRWEFANEWFLRGQKHLLKNIVRKKNSPAQINEDHHHHHLDEEAEEMEREIDRMRKDQEEMEKEIQEMTKRLETTERRPEQMMEFLCKVVEDPDILPKMIIERERRTRHRQIYSGDAPVEKKRRLILTSPSSIGAATTSNSGRTTEEEEASSSLGFATTSSSSPEVELICNSSNNGICTEAWFGSIGSPAATVEYGGGVAGYIGFVCDAPVVVEAEVPPYPFSLLGGGF